MCSPWNKCWVRAPTALLERHSLWLTLLPDTFSDTFVRIRALCLDNWNRGGGGLRGWLLFLMRRTVSFTLNWAVLPSTQFVVLPVIVAVIVRGLLFVASTMTCIVGLKRNNWWVYLRLPTFGTCMLSRIRLGCLVAYSVTVLLLSSVRSISVILGSFAMSW